MKEQDKVTIISKKMWQRYLNFQFIIVFIVLLVTFAITIMVAVDALKTWQAWDSKPVIENIEASGKSLIEQYPELKKLTASDFPPSSTPYPDNNEQRASYLRGYIMGVEQALILLRDARGVKSITTSGAKKPKEYGYEDGIHAVRIKVGELISSL